MYLLGKFAKFAILIFLLPQTDSSGHHSPASSSSSVNGDATADADAGGNAEASAHAQNQAVVVSLKGATKSYGKKKKGKGKCGDKKVLDGLDMTVRKGAMWVGKKRSWSTLFMYGTNKRRNGSKGTEGRTINVSIFDLIYVGYRVSTIFKKTA